MDGATPICSTQVRAETLPVFQHLEERSAVTLDFRGAEANDELQLGGVARLQADEVDERAVVADDVGRHAR